MATHVPAPWPLTDEQRSLVELCHDFAAKEIRPRGREVDEADVVTPVDIFAQGRGGRHHRLHDPRGARRRRLHRRLHPVPGAGGAVLGRPGHRKPGVLQRLLLRPHHGPGHRRAEEAVADAAHRPGRADDLAGHHRARLRFRRRVDRHRPPPGWTAATASTGRRRGSPTPARPSSTSCSPRPTARALGRGVRRSCSTKDTARPDVRRADEEDGPARHRVPRDLPRRRLRARGGPAR